MEHQVVVGGVNAGIGPGELGGLREGLVEQRAFRLDQLAQLGHVAPARAQRARERGVPSQLEVHVKLCASARMVLADVEAALARMDEGSYGLCLRCGHPMDLPRLRIVPQARYCAPCHRTREVNR
ncbi:TraR/DksA family transcriptional regulator [Streptomyces sp. NBC_00670]|jgi:RNA polymerase-binding transcription factor DksA|uniref:TraR/DksA family transcriptional regulator n=1 Tax=Streptomyces sp. NBC_00670 TaxID=2975804 RepID=UPI002E37289F|nr:TraR/DksA C4-type zinc finger protein [Streptomyces sp. NBC_00670]